MAQLITQRSKPVIAIGYARRSWRAMAGTSIESGQQTGLRTSGMRRLDCCSFYLPPDWKRLVPERTAGQALSLTAYAICVIIYALCVTHLC